VLDNKHMQLRAGKGGNGAISFHSEPYKPRGGPDGGDGGWGGTIYLVPRKGVRTLGHLLRRFNVYADDGANGSGKDKTGKKGKDTIVEVPLGTVVWKENGDGTREQLTDLMIHNRKFAVARGGAPGYGNHRFVTSTNQEPLLAEGGDLGESMLLFLEVKVLGDVALVGSPNAGKSTLLSVISRARPKIAAYPFTTLEPVLGMVYHRGRELVVVDVPGLIEGASEGKGLGLEFLRHTERVQVLVHLVDGSVENVGEEYLRVAKELELYPGGLDAKPRIVVLNKIDIPDVRDQLAGKMAELVQASGQVPSVLSGVAGEGLEALLDRLLPLIPEADDTEDQEPEPKQEMAVSSLRSRRVRIEHDGEIFVVSCAPLERFVPMVRFNDWRARMQFHAEMERFGVITALEKAGVQAGDTVRIASRELVWD
jgi:GTP-binding protein